ncbi:MAG: RNA polymerase sigma factor [Spirochaetes bacterium]|nr:RNA polymerase sigma factor [Spirochaetota bacterium]
MISKEELISLYTTYYKEIFNYIYHLIGSYESAEDILQDTFINLIEYSKKTDINPNTVKSLLYTSAHNLSINYLKKNVRTDSFEEDSPYVISNDTVENDLLFQEIQQEVANALKELDPISRSIFILKRENNYSNEEIAKLLQISERTVRRKLQSTVIHIVSYLKNKGFYENL